MVFEQIGTMMSSINILGLGAYPVLLSISIGISLLISQKRTGEFLLILGIINFITGTGLFIATTEYKYLIITALTTIIILMLPGRTEE